MSTPRAVTASACDNNHIPVSTWPKRLEEWMLDRGFTRKP